jgi:hypothetical protein
MAEPPAPVSGPISQILDRDLLLGWLREQRWFASKSQTLCGLELVEEAAIDEHLALALVQVEFATGQHELYQLVLAQDTGSAGVDVLNDSQHAHELLAAIDQGLEIAGLQDRKSVV